ncbi:MAG: LD-carboxypeptidase [Clostridia bacterium]|nr:LD-carboxypeptidase [Clostridia bacterium]
MSVIPKPLSLGDRVRIIAISGCLHEENPEKELRDAEAKVRSYGFIPVMDESCRRQYGYLSGTDRERADTLMRAFEDETTQGIICLKGGWGVMRMLDMVDYEVIRRHPKVFVGYSDITSMHLALRQKADLATFHGPMAHSKRMSGKALESFLGALTGKIAPSLQNPDGTKLSALRPGQAEGELMGGNLTLMAAACGTRYDPDVRGKILCLEDIGEHVYRLDRSLWQLKLAGKLDECAGIVLGTFTGCDSEYEGTDFSLEKVLQDLTHDLKVPVMTGLHFGHVQDSLTLPLGRMYRMDTGRGTLELAESVS